MSGAVEVRRLARQQLDELIARLRAWETPGGYPLGLHAGDVGWHARLPDDMQRAAFDGSTFTVEAWHRMSSTAAYDPELDLLAKDGDGAPVAAATAWSAGPGRSAILEPVGSHPEHRGGGHGRRVVLAALGALARAGASGVTVHTPADNRTAVAAYESCGLRPLHSTEALVRDAQTSTSHAATG